MNLYKHLSAITKSKATASRPILQHFHYSKEMQSVSACDSHRLLEFKSNETIEKNRKHSLPNNANGGRKHTLSELTRCKTF